MARVLVSYSFRRGAIPLGENIAQALEQLGHEAIRFDSHPDERWMRGRRLLKSLAKLVNAKTRAVAYFERRERARQAAAFLACVQASQPDVAIVIRGDSIPIDAVEACARFGVRRRVVWWVKHPRWQDALLREAPHFDAAFSIDGTLANQGIRALPSWALQSDVFFADGRPKTIPLLFAGAYSERRERFLEPLAGAPLTIVGPGWSSRLPRNSPLRARLGASWLSSARLADLYRDARVVIDIHQVEQTLGQGANMRFADVPACGSLLLTEPAADLGTRFVPEEHISVFRSGAELSRKASLFAANPSLAEAMGRAAAERALQLPTFLDRARALLGED